MADAPVDQKPAIIDGLAIAQLTRCDISLPSLNACATKLIPVSLSTVTPAAGLVMTRVGPGVGVAGSPPHSTRSTYRDKCDGTDPTDARLGSPVDMGV